MSEFIKREAVMKAFADFVWNSNHSDPVPAPTWNQAVDIVRDFPVADVAPVRHGRWIETEQPCGWCEEVCAECSECGEDFVLGEYSMDDLRSLFRYCPNCGAKMDGGAER